MSQNNYTSMDNWREDYEECDITIDIECEELPEEIFNSLFNSPPTTPQIMHSRPKHASQPSTILTNKPKNNPITSASTSKQTVANLNPKLNVPLKPISSQAGKKHPTSQNNLKPNITVIPKPKTKPKQTRELRLELRSPQLQERFKRVVQNVPGRVKEALRIFDFIVKSENGSSSPLCLHGNTGCGKTSLITKVLEFFEENSSTVSVAYLNCMSIRTVNLIYVYLLQRFYPDRRTGRAGRTARAAEGLRECLEEERRKGDERTKIVVLDQIDHVIGEQNFLYNMLQWLGVGSIVLVLISNVIDLAVRLDGKLQSRWKFETIIFQPYSHQDIEKIIYHNYTDIQQICKKEAISFIAKRIYNINSDIRTLHKIYQRIKQTHQQTKSSRLLDIDAVKGLIYDQNRTPPLQNSYLILTRILHQAEKRADVAGEIMQKLFLQGRRKPKKEEILYMLCDLQDMGLISLCTGRKPAFITFHNYGINVHENLRLFVQNADK